MKTQRAVLPLAFLSAAFMLACQEQGSSPVEPEGPGILLDKDGEHPHGSNRGSEANHYTATLLGDVSSVGSFPLVGTDNAITLNSPHGPFEPADLDLSFFVTFFNALDLSDGDDGSTCFGVSPFEGGFQVGTDKPNKDPDELKTFFWFDALGDDGTTVVNYVLNLFGVKPSGEDWLPTGTTTIAGSPGTFKMRHANGPGSKVACLGEGVLSFELEVTLLDP